MGSERQTERQWAVFCNEEEGYSFRVSRWTDREKAEDVLTSLLEDGERCMYLAPDRDAS
jgi:hypothetical protein